MCAFDLDQRCGEPAAAIREIEACTEKVRVGVVVLVTGDQTGIWIAQKAANVRRRATAGNFRITAFKNQNVSRVIYADGRTRPPPNRPDIQRFDRGRNQPVYFCLRPWDYERAAKARFHADYLPSFSFLLQRG